MHMLPA